MSTFNKFEGFIGYLGLGAVNLNTDTLKVYLTNNTPSASADDVKTDLAEITQSPLNGYTEGGVDIQNTYSESGGTGTLVAVDVVITASGGTIGPFRYAVIYDDTHASDVLMGWYDYAEALSPQASITLQDGESITIDFGANLATYT